MTGLSPAIRTPDQKLRVFISSTLKELAAERKSARTAVERLHLAPVMFELGARPHPPRDLYRAYLDQSDIFVGIYGDRYGWVAPTETVSGLEDEFALSGALPKLIYIRETAGEREPRLNDLLDRIRSDDTASFKYFSDADALTGLIEADLATLLAERFAASTAAAPQEAPAAALDTFPSPVTELIGREREVAGLKRILGRPAVRLVTVTGPGGMGKTRLAIDVGEDLAGAYPDGVYFVDLAPVQDPAGVATAIAETLGVRNTGDDPVEDKLVIALRGRRVLLVLDNFEQLLPAAAVVTRLLAALPELNVLVTSRALLRVNGEHNFELGPLAQPPGHADGGPAVVPLESALRSPAVALFVERSRAVRPDFELTAANVAAVVRICAALDGVPLALELAAARIRLLPPDLMLARLDRRLPLLTGGVTDLPARQQTLRRTIQWSTQLLGDEEQRLLARLGVFVGGFTLEAVESICGGGDADVLGMLGALVDSSLVRQEERTRQTYFSMLATVREYALEKLEDSGGLDEMRRAHADYFVRVAANADTLLYGEQQGEWMARLADDRENLRATERFFLDTGDAESATAFAWSLYLYWWIGGQLGEVRGWMEEVLASGAELSPAARARALYFTGAIRFWQDPGEGIAQTLTESAALFEREGLPRAQALTLVSVALAALERGDAEEAESVLETSVHLFREANDRWGEAMALVSLGLAAILQQKLTRALNRFEESLALTLRQKDQLGAAIAMHHTGWAHLLLGNKTAATAQFENSLVLSRDLGHTEGVAYGLEALTAVAAQAGDVARAGRLYGAALSLREQAGLFNAPSISFHRAWVGPLQSGPLAAEFAAGEAEGRHLGARAAVAYALPPAKGGAGEPFGELSGVSGDTE
jgi:predicted ATPase/predicted negative regulator of RcsB-dependent stress response